MKTRLIKLDYEKLRNVKNLTEEEIDIILNNLLRFEFLLRGRLKEENLDISTEHGFLDGISSIEWAIKYLIDINNKEKYIKDTTEDFNYIIFKLHKGLKDLFKNEDLDEDSFELWLISRGK